jgi:DNA polymerase elongation subunit (family B)
MNLDQDFIVILKKKINELLTGYYIEPKVIYGDTDSVFFCPHITNIQDGARQSDKKSLEISIQLGLLASAAICLILPEPHDLEYEKTYWPLMILTKKKYVGNLYEEDPDVFHQKSMGIVLKRRDNSPIVKIVCGGIIDQLINNKSIDGAISWIEKSLKKILANKYDLNKFIITKTLRDNYKVRTRIVHAVLADRMGERDPGNKPISNDRIPYAYVITKKKNIKLQGDRVEHPDYIKQNNLQLDYLFYITNQIQKPAIQFLELVMKNPDIIFKKYIQFEENRRKGYKQTNVLFNMVCK